MTINTGSLSLISPELPKPELASLSELRDMSMQVLRATNPTQLAYSYEELKAMDDVSVTIMPEKKGMVFKHVEYLVESRVSSWGQLWIWAGLYRDRGHPSWRSEIH